MNAPACFVNARYSRNVSSHRSVDEVFMEVYEVDYVLGLHYSDCGVFV
jgi:hypothetical protein